MNKYCKLNTSIIKVIGKDNKTFLQSLITQDINLTNDGKTIYTLLLNNKGRYLFNMYIIPHKDTYLIEINSQKATDLIDLLNFYKLRLNVFFELTNFSSFYIFNNKLDINLIDNNIMFKDPRLTNLGYKLIQINNTNPLKLIMNLTDINDYTLMRYKLGIPEDSELIPEKSIPIECGFDELMAINYTKGCYLGQEFTNSAKRILEIRKRIIIFKGNSLQNINHNDNIINKNNETVGNILGVYKDFIMSLVKIKEVINNQDQDFMLQSSKELIKPIIPNWIKYFSLN